MGRVRLQQKQEKRIKRRGYVIQLSIIFDSYLKMAEATKRSLRVKRAPAYFGGDVIVLRYRVKSSTKSDTRGRLTTRYIGLELGLRLASSGAQHIGQTDVKVHQFRQQTYIFGSFRFAISIKE